MFVLDCVECECDEYGSIGQSCDLVTGKCKCKHNFIGDKCSECAPNLFNCKENIHTHFIILKNKII